MISTRKNESQRHTDGQGGDSRRPCGGAQPGDLPAGGQLPLRAKAESPEDSVGKPGPQRLRPKALPVKEGGHFSVCTGLWGR